jgi:hypothetical protein
LSNHCESLVLHKTEHLEWAAKINDLRARRDGLVSSHEAKLADLARQFEMTRERFELVLESKVGSRISLLSSRLR